MSDTIVPLRVYYLIFGVLLVLTAVTVAVATVDLGWLNTTVALAIAITKAMLVILYFMHLRYSSQLTWIFAAAGFVFLAILLAFTIGDYVGRSWEAVPASL